MNVLSWKKLTRGFKEKPLKPSDQKSGCVSVLAVGTLYANLGRKYLQTSKLTDAPLPCLSMAVLATGQS